jgi:integrase
VGVEYYSAHKLRHGHAVYALKHAKTMAELKAISQNLMHSSIGITDGIYGRLVDDDVNRVITHLGT